MARARFSDWVANRYPDPTDSLTEFFDDAVQAAASVGALLDHLPALDGVRHYLPSIAGKRDRKQFYRASLETDKDGTSWPAVTFKTFRGGSVYWRPRDLAWQSFMADRAPAAANDVARQAYRDAAAAAVAAAEAKAAEHERQQAEGHAAAAAAAVAAWEVAEPCQAHAYLERKGVPSHGLRVASADMHARLWSDADGEWKTMTAVRAGDLLIPMRDQAGALVNLQRIDATGRKRFLMGGQAHGCHFVIEGATGRTVLAEGYATGATWHQATGDTVALAFSAGALPVVASYIRADLVAADHDASQAGEKAAQATGLPYLMPPTVGDWNDAGPEAVRAAMANASAESFKQPWKLPAPELKGREQTWWNKLADAATAADAAALAWAIARRLVVRVPVLTTLEALLEQLRQAAPVGLMNPATLEAIRGALAGMLDWRRRRALAGVTMSAEAMARHGVETVSELPQLGADDYAGTLLLSAPMGSGKTQRIGKPFAAWAMHQDARFVATCHRQSLVAELARVLGCDHYQDTDRETAWAVQALATCLPSLVKADHAQIIDEAGFVFIDEIAQVLRSIASKVTVADKKTRADVFRALRALVSRARCVIGADAGMDDRVLAFLESCRPGERFRIIQQPHVGDGLAVSFGYGPDALATVYGEAMARLSHGERLWVSCGEKSRAIEAARVLGTTGARILLLHGDNRDNAEQAEFWRDPEGVSRSYQCVIHTGVISSGLSIEHRAEGPHFTHGMLLASGATITPADALQMLRRVRYLRAWTVAVTPNNAKDIDNADAILAGMEQAAGLEGLTVHAATEFDSFVAGIEADNARHRADFAAGLWWALQEQRFSVKRLAIQAGEDLAASLKVVRAEIRDERMAAILSAPDLTDEEARRLRDRPSRTEAEQFALLRHRIKTDLGLDDVDEEAVEVWDDGRGPRRMDRFSAATMRLADRKDDTGSDLALHRFGKARALAYAWLLDSIDLAPGLRVDEAMAKHLIARVIERRHLLAFLGIVPAKWARDTATDSAGSRKPFPAPAYPVRELGEILERMGLELKRREVSSGEPKRRGRPPKNTPTWGDIPLEVITPCGGNYARNRPHELTAASWGRVAMWAARRNQKRQTAVAMAANDAEYWLSVRRGLWLRAEAGTLTGEQALAELMPKLRSRERTRNAKLTAWWATAVLRGRCCDAR